MRELVANCLIYVLYPLWLLAGAADYVCHRLSHIEKTSGVVESWLHVAQFVALCIALTVVAFFEITVAALLLLVFAVVLHSVLAHVDVAYTLGRRHVSAFEQQIHGYLDVIPVITVMLVALLHWDQLQALSWTLRLRSDAEEPQPPLFVLIGFVVLAGTAIAEELWRTHRAAQNAGVNPAPGMNVPRRPGPARDPVP